MKFDDILVEVGEFGPYQKKLYIFLCMFGISSGCCMVSSVVLLAVPNHRCAIPGLVNDTYAAQNDYHRYLINQTIPPSDDATLDYDPCNYYVDELLPESINGTTFRSKQRCDKWVYDQSVFTSTFATKENLVCADKTLASLAKMLFFAGVLAGAMVFGNLSDLIGRKKVYCISLVLKMTSSIILCWSPTYIVFVTLYFLAGAANTGVYMTGFVISMEMVGSSKRKWAGTIINFFVVVGYLQLTAIGYFLRQWDHIAMAIAFPHLIYLLNIWFIPESPRWLLSRGRVEEAKALLQRAAKENGVELPAKLFDESIEGAKVHKGNFVDLFRSKVVTTRTFVIFFNWMVVSLIYYGFSLNIGNLGGNFYLNFLIGGLVEIPAYIVCIFLLDRTGRKWLYAVSMMFGGICCISTVFTTVFGGDHLHPLTVVLAMMGKLGSAMAYCVIYIYSAELYPTVVRTAGMGASSCFARIGGMAAPYIADLSSLVSGEVGRALPLVVFGGVSVAAGLLSLLLPETLNRQLPESIEDARNFSRKPCKKAIREIYINEGFKWETLKDKENGKQKPV